MKAFEMEMLKKDLINGFKSENLCSPRSSYCPENARISLNGKWIIKEHKSFWEIDESALSEELLNEIWVSSCVQFYGYGHFQYTNVNYPIPCDPPYTPWENPAYHYRKEVFLTKKGSNKYYIVFEGVDSCFYLYVNKKYVGFSQISHRVSEFDITGQIVDGKNEIDVLVVKWCAGTYLEDQDKWRFTGIFRDVYILSRPQNHIVDYKIETKIDGTVKFSYLKGVDEAEIRFNGEAKKVKAGEIIIFKVEKPKLWFAETPHLYDLTINCAGETIKEKVGIREITVEDGIFKINGRHVKLKGANRHDHHPQKGPAVSEEDIYADLILMKQYGINAVRTSHYPSAPVF